MDSDERRGFGQWDLIDALYEARLELETLPVDPYQQTEEQRQEYYRRLLILDANTERIAHTSYKGTMLGASYPRSIFDNWLRHHFPNYFHKFKDEEYLLFMEKFEKVADAYFSDPQNKNRDARDAFEIYLLDVKPTAP